MGIVLTCPLSLEGEDFPNDLGIQWFRVCRGIEELREAELGVHLALSLHAPDDATRADLLPMGRRFDVAEVLAAAAEDCSAEEERQLGLAGVPLPRAVWGHPVSGGPTEAEEEAAAVEAEEIFCAELCRLCSSLVAAEPRLIACGGAGSLDHMREATDAGASAVAAGAYFVWQGPHRAVLITYPRPAEIAAVWRKQS